VDLLDAMQKHPDFKSGNPSSTFTQFLSRIENADPNSPEVKEDDSNESWGHYPFAGANMTISTVLLSWDDVGNTATACRLIAAAIKTCKVA